MGCPHTKGDEVCATCAAAAARPPEKATVAPEDESAETLRRPESSDSLGPQRPPATASEKIGRYVVQDVLGQGGMGLVYTAFDPVLNRKVAIKVLRARPGKGSHSTGESTRLLREAQAMAQLSHPNVVPVFDFGVAGDDVYVAMELVVGSTLYDWVKTKRPNWREVMPVFLAAGRGLEAAHAAGLVHRDFKPTNVLLDDKLQPHITDFGLARSVRSTSSDDTVSEDFDISQPVSFDTPITRAGQVMGSPGYMAPEQYDGASTSPATDQYAYCVTLYEALYGKRPFKAPDLRALGDLARKGEVPAPPKGSAVPPWLFEIIKKGLSPKVEHRHASMTALLAALSRDPARVRRRWAVGVGSTLFVLGLVGGLFWNAAQVRRACLSSSERVSRVWGDQARGVAGKAFLDTGRSWAPVAWDHARDAMDAYAQAWTRARVDACEATYVRSEQTAHQLALRLDCLDRQLDEIATLSATFAAADPALVGQAADAVARLTPVATCANLQALELRARSSPRNKDEDARVQRETAAGRLLVAAGRLTSGREKLEPAVKQAEAVGDPALIADAFEALGELERAAGKFSESRLAYERAAEASLAAGDDGAAARHLAALVSLVGWRLERPAEGMTLAAIARGLLSRLGGDPATEARIAEGVGDAQWQAGDRAASLVSYQKALDLLVKVEGNESLDAARLKSSIGWVLNEQGQFAKAREMLELSHGTRERLLGPDHPLLAETWNELGTLEVQAGEPHEAVRCFLRALEIQRQNLAPDSFPLTRMLINLSDAYVEEGHPAAAVPYLAQATRNLENKTDAPASWTVHFERVQARVLGAQGKWPEALKLIEDSVRTARASFGPTHPSTGASVLVQGMLLVDSGKSREGLAVLDEFLSVISREGQFNGPERPGALVYSARALVKLKRPTDAVERLERALTLLATMTWQKSLKAEAQLGLADALWAAGSERARARELGAAALALFAAIHRADDEARARSWVEVHR